MKDIQISCCDNDNKINTFCLKIKENENLNDLRKQFEKSIAFKNLFFYSKDSNLIKNEEEKNIKIVDCLKESEIKFSINLKLIINIEETKIINKYLLNNISLFELRKNLGDEINFKYKFWNEKGFILNEKETYVFDINKNNEIKMKKINEGKMKKMLKIIH